MVVSTVDDGGMNDDLQTLCRSCGLCCDGSLFGRGTLEPDEVAVARKNHLRVIPRGTAFEQPCSALSGSATDRTCAIYAERPRACHAFTCRLYDRHTREGGPLEARLEAVRRVRVLLQVVEATADEEKRRVVLEELTRRMEEDFARA